jgi:hypothetical protein
MQREHGVKNESGIERNLGEVSWWLVAWGMQSIRAQLGLIT